MFNELLDINCKDNPLAFQAAIGSMVLIIFKFLCSLIRGARCRLANKLSKIPHHCMDEQYIFAPNGNREG